MEEKSNIKAKEEIINSITHIPGIIFGISVLVFSICLSINHGTVWHIVSSAIYGSSIIFLYLASTLFHSARKIRRKYYLNILDHSAIYLLIAGTYTPFTLITLHGPWGWTLFGIEWGLAIMGIIFKMFFYSKKFRTLSAIIYVIMGWVVLVALKPLIQSISVWGLIWLFAGGVSYSVGVIFYLRNLVKFSHGVFHIFILLGTIFHFISIYFYVLQN